MGKSKEWYMQLQELEADDVFDSHFEWNGDSDDMTMPDYLKASGDTLYNISGEIPKLLEIDFK